MRTHLLLYCTAFLLCRPAIAAVTPNGNQLWHLDQPLIDEVAEAGDDLGWALASGDFDCDEVDDLAVGIPGRDFLFGVTDMGSVLVLYGSGGGLAPAGHQLLTQGIGAEGIEDFDRFGQVLASGDFDGDDCDDLAVGVPLEDLTADAGETDEGAVSVFYGSASGLGGHQLWHQSSPGVPGVPEPDDRFGSTGNTSRWSATTP